ncbi:geranylgeranyl transferase type-2 subunit alpha-like [Amphiura filiformis]|uniref:geranylgeranyl transferase type-2 subunit alpha-like n=1 Tax=Amphiura filiformis TaxID=82378 RepID=UPI003B20E932
MHGRIKVKTTAEQQEAKRKEREKKQLKYTAGTKKAFEKRKNGEFDEEAVEITGQLLSANPDFYSLWNFRREIFLHFIEKKPSEEVQEIFDKELSFLESCLQVNPKSYGVWHHRGWILDHMPKPDWQQEVKLCNLFLQYDERNFHCWDYRRIVVSRAKVPPAEELKFTYTKISTNFSNYSSWHYRSKLLPLMYPDPDNKGRVKEDTLLEEYELVQNAFFTDPNDQSAWFYHRWLLGKAEKAQGINLLHVSRDQHRLVVVFTQPIQLSTEKDTCQVTIDGSIVAGRWTNSKGSNSHSMVWIFDIPDTALTSNSQHLIQVQLNPDQSTQQCTLLKDASEVLWRDTEQTESLFTSELSAEKSDVLTKELESCQQLQELEPDNKWCVLTIILLMGAIDPLKYEADMIQYFETLLKADPARAAYFKDLRSKIVLENAIVRSLRSDSREIDVSGKQLTALYHLEHLAGHTHINLSSNQLSALNDCHMLQCVQTLITDNNKIGDLSRACNLSCLEMLSLKSNCITTIDQLSPLATCTRLRALDLHDNPVCSLPEFKDKIKALLPQLSQLNGEQL